MNSLKKITLVAICTVLVSGHTVAGQVNSANITSFSANTPAVATEVNGNFSELTTQINDNDTNIAEKQQRVTGNCATGSSISEINADGSVICETGGSGSGLDADTLDGNHASDFTASSQTCVNGQVTGIDASGNVTCSSEVYFSVKYNAQVAWPGANCSIQNLTYATDTTVIDNVGNALNLTTGFFTAPVSGTYSFTGTVHFRSISTGDLIYVEIHAAGINYNGPSSRASGTIEAHSRSITVHLDMGERAYLKAYACASGGSPTMYGNNADWSWTSFVGARVF